MAGSSHLVSDYDVRLRADRVLKLEDDEDLKYVLASTDGYLAQGLTYVMELFEYELDLILEEAISLNELLFSLYVVTVVVVFWYFLFNRSMNHAAREAENARELVLKVPLHILTQEEVDGIADFFKDEDEDDGEEYDGHREQVGI
mmetsp:Transcript_84143/g.126148  ORF Transcript_84143/g.126148 Transcript_84143/m.126148 type:complete len:145 (-) Transcript_84143:198-632(-)